MTRDEVFQLYMLVQNRDKKAEDKLIALHKELYPNSSLNNITRGASDMYREYLHMMYLHVHRKNEELRRMYV